MRRRARGFTLVELITTMILIGILSAVAIPRLSGTSSFSERGFRDGVFTALSHARRVAVASRRFVCVSITSSIVTVTRDLGTNPEAAASVSCTAPVPLPGAGSGCSANAVCAPNGVAAGGTAIVVFDPLGRSITTPNTVAPATVTISNQADITVAAETGYVQ
ncbi:MAG: type II secretion system protein [Rhodocyclaceae bacterium]|nr:type II secretion system protein [Rhodocyclaceae bacterium]